MQRYQTILLFGPPGAGKGTQGKILGSIPGFFHCACGDVFRRLNTESKFGRLFLEYSSKGELVPDDLTVSIWSEQIHAQTVLGAYKPESDLLILDGIPRTLAQAKRLTESCDVLKVIHLVCPDEQKMIERLQRRALKENRIDDAKESVIRHRWEVYRAETEPVLGYYPREIISETVATASPAEVLVDILCKLIPVQNAHFEKLRSRRTSFES